MRKVQKIPIIAFAWIILLLASRGHGYAWTQSNLAIHGFGGWAYGQTDNENQYLVGNEDGNYDSVNFSLNLSANPSERLSAHVQTAYNEGGIEGREVGLDYAFAEWYVSDALRLRAGKVKAPFMLYTEIYDVGTLRPFFNLSPGVYQELAAEAYNGVGLTGNFTMSSDWEFRYDLYGGQLRLLPNKYIDVQTYQFALIETTASDILGARIAVLPPFSGLQLALSLYTGNFETDVPGNSEETQWFDDRYTLIGISAEYLSDRWSMRSEYLMQKESPKIEIDVVCAEIAYFLTERWQVAARYEAANFELATIPEFDSSPDSASEHRESAFGVNYWINPNLVVKLSGHVVHGNRFASPEKIEDYLTAVQQQQFEEETRLLLLGVQFSF